MFTTCLALTFNIIDVDVDRPITDIGVRVRVGRVGHWTDIHSSPFPHGPPTLDWLMSVEGLQSIVAAFRRPTAGRYSEDSLRYVLIGLSLVEVAFLITFLANHVKCTPPNIDKRNLTTTQLPDLAFVELKCSSTATERFSLLFVSTFLFLCFTAGVYSRSSAYLSELSSAIRKRVRHEEVQLELSRDAAAAAAAAAATAAASPRPLSATYNPTGSGVRPVEGATLRRSLGGEGLASGLGESWGELEDPTVIGDELEEAVVAVVERFRRFKVGAIVLYCILFVLAAVQASLYAVDNNLNSFECDIARFTGINFDYPELSYTCASVIYAWLGVQFALASLLQFGMLTLLFTTYRSLSHYKRDRSWHVLFPSENGVADVGGAASNPLIPMGSGRRDDATASLLYGAVSGFLAGEDIGTRGGKRSHGSSAIPGGGIGMGGAGAGGLGGDLGGGLSGLTQGLTEQLGALQSSIAGLTAVTDSLQTLGDPAVMGALGGGAMQQLVLEGVSARFRTAFVDGLQAMVASIRSRGSAQADPELDTFISVLESKLEALSSGADPDPDLAAGIAAGQSSISGN